MCTGRFQSACNVFGWIDSFLNLSPLDMTVSRNVISVSEVSTVNLIVGWKLLACFMNRSISGMLESHNEKM